VKAIILAAGEGKRMKSNTPKVLHKVCGLEIINHVINACKFIKKIILVLGYKHELIAQKVKDINIVIQDKQLGTGHAVMCARKFICDQDEILILNGDMPLVSSEILKKIILFHKENNNIATIVSSCVDNPSGYGRIVRDENKNFIKIIEERDANKKELLIREINTGIYILNGKILNQALELLNNNNAQHEFYLTDALEIIKNILKNNNQEEKIKVMCVNKAQEFFGINDKLQLMQANKIMRIKINKFHMLNGVSLLDLENIFIDHGVEIAQDTVIESGVYLLGNTKLGRECKIGANTKIINSQIGDHVDILFSVILNSQINNNSRIGPFAYIRPDSFIHENVKIGDFVEIKNSVIESGTKVSHLTYVGDSDIGKNINFGCGSVTVNYDGKKKSRTVIKENSFIGCNANLIAPVTIGKNSYIAAGSTITNDVPDYSLAIARERQTNKLDRYKK